MPSSPPRRHLVTPLHADTGAQPETLGTREAADLLGLAVRSIQLMVDRGELDAWKTPGGHRRIARASIKVWQDGRRNAVAPPEASRDARPVPPRGGQHPRVLLIEDSMHYQNLVSLLVRQRFPQVDLHMASDGIVGLAMVGELKPDVLLVDILLPGIDGAALITSLRSQPRFRAQKLIVVTSLDDSQRAPYAFALGGVALVHKPRLVTDLPPRLASCLPGPSERGTRRPRPAADIQAKEPGESLEPPGTPETAP